MASSPRGKTCLLYTSVIALPGPFNDAPALPVAFIPLAVILVMYLARGRMPNADGLFAL